MNTECVQIRVRIKDLCDATLVEAPWAEPLLASDFGGDYRLHSDLFMAPLLRGDVVRCEVTPDGSLQVVDIRQLLPGLLLGFEHPAHTDSEVKPVLRRMRTLGYQVRRPVDGCVEVFVPGAELDRDLLFPQLPPTWRRRELLDGPFRMRAIMEQVDFSLTDAQLLVEDCIDHRSPNDPEWARMEPEIAGPG